MTKNQSNLGGDIEMMRDRLDDLERLLPNLTDREIMNFDVYMKDLIKRFDRYIPDLEDKYIYKNES